jgi:hypothetical protein
MRSSKFRKLDHEARWGEMGFGHDRHPKKENRLKKREVEDELNKLKTENKRLKREIARLTKFLSRPLSESEDEFNTNLVPKSSAQCPKCKCNEIGEVKIGTKLIMVCKKCLWRKMV